MGHIYCLKTQAVNMDALCMIASWHLDLARPAITATGASASVPEYHYYSTDGSRHTINTRCRQGQRHRWHLGVGPTGG